MGGLHNPPHGDAPAPCGWLGWGGGWGLQNQGYTIGGGGWEGTIGPDHNIYIYIYICTVKLVWTDTPRPRQEPW